MDKKANVKFYEKKWFLWVTLIFFAPVGIFLMWKYNYFTKNLRIVLSVVFGLFFIIVAFSSDDNKTENNTAIEFVDNSRDQSKAEKQDKFDAEEKEKQDKRDAEAKEKQDKKDAEAKEKADLKEIMEKEKAEAERLARIPISTDFSSFHDPYRDMTDLQKDAYWEEVKGKYVQWTGKVNEVTKDSVIMIVKNTTFISDFRATIVVDERDKLININKDDTITIHGKLNSKTGIIMPWGLNDARIID